MYVKEKQSLGLQYAACVAPAHCVNALTRIYNDDLHGEDSLA